MPSRSTEISTFRQSSLPVAPSPLHPQLDRELRVAVTRLDPPLEAGRTDYEIAADCALSASMRDALARRKALLDECLGPAGPGLVAAQLETLIDAGMQMRGDEPGAATRWAVTAAQDLMDLPGFAIVGACQNLRRGIVGDGKWLPETGVIRTVAQRKVHEIAKQRREIIAVLGARIRASRPDPDRKAVALRAARDFVARGEDALKAERRGRMTPHEIADAEVVTTALRTGRDTRPMPKASPVLRHCLGLPDEVPNDDRFFSEAAE